MTVARPLNVTPRASIKEVSTLTPPPSHRFTSVIPSRQGTLNIKRLTDTTGPFFTELQRACSQLLSLIVWPVILAMADSFAAHFTSSMVAEMVTVVPTKAQVASSDPKVVKRIEKAFAEKFKFIICTSYLLTSTLSISSYDQKMVSPISSSAKEQTTPMPLGKPKSIAYHHLVTAKPANPKRSRSSLHFTAPGEIFFDATIAAIVALRPFSSSRQAWIRGVVCLVSLAWGAISIIGIDDAGEMSFEITHKPLGSYKLSDYDASRPMISDSSVCKSNEIKADMCEQMTGLVNACKSFDIECNKAIAAVQEVEVISRGFKLSHPLPPISRIESNNPVVSPGRLRNGSWAGATSNHSTIRLSRSSSNGTSASSNWKQQSSRPQSILFTADNAMAANGRRSPMDFETELIRMATLRKELIVSFDAAKDALHRALTGLEPLVDKTELKTLEEMYEVEQSHEEPDVVSPMDRSPIPARNVADKRSSWVSLARLRSEDEVTNSTSIDEGDRPATPQRMSLTLENNSISTSLARKRESGTSETWSVTSPSRDLHPIRGGSRLGYVSDRAHSITPNQTAESKRLSYISAATSAASPLQSKSFLMQQTSPALASQTPQRRRPSLLNSGLLDDCKQSPVSVAKDIDTPNKSEAYLISSLKASFEKVHLLRKQVLCHFLALDFSLQTDSVNGGSKIDYWASVSQVKRELTKTMKRLASNCKEQVEKEMAIGQAGSADMPLIASPNKSESAIHDYTGVEDRIAAMGLTLRSIQVKMLVCAKDLKVKGPSALHGTSTALPSEDSNASVTSGYEKSEKIFETIREDLLTLSAEWENALKIMKCQSSTEGVGETTSSTINSSRLDSPQEAEEDALRQWVQARRTEGDSSDSEDEKVASRMIESGLLQWTGLDRDNHRYQDNVNLSDLLIKTATPDHLPPPGLEKVYESIGGQLEAKRQKSALSREERIRLAKEERAAAAQANEKPTVDASSVIMEELQAVMKNRKSLRRDNVTAQNDAVKAGLHSIPDIPSRQAQANHVFTPPTMSIDDKQTAFAF
jgi:hypothetical protein